MYCLFRGVFIVFSVMFSLFCLLITPTLPSEGGSHSVFCCSESVLVDDLNPDLIATKERIKPEKQIVHFTCFLFGVLSSKQGDLGLLKGLLGSIKLYCLSADCLCMIGVI